MRQSRKSLNEFQQVDDKDVRLFEPGGSVRLAMTFITLLLVPALSFADCNMTGTCPGSPNPQYNADAHGSTLEASNMFSELAKAIATGAGMDGKSRSEAGVVPNKQATESLTRKGQRGKIRVNTGEDDPGKEIIQ